MCAASVFLEKFVNRDAVFTVVPFFLVDSEVSTLLSSIFISCQIFSILG